MDNQHDETKEKKLQREMQMIFNKVVNKLKDCAWAHRRARQQALQDATKMYALPIQAWKGQYLI